MIKINCINLLSTWIIIIVLKTTISLVYIKKNLAVIKII